MLLLDEPFSALDAVTRRGLQRDIRSIISDIGITLVTVTHDLDEAILLGDQVIAMVPNPGKISEIIDTKSVSDGHGAKAISERLMAILDKEVVGQTQNSNVGKGFVNSKEDFFETTNCPDFSYSENGKGKVHA